MKQLNNKSIIITRKSVCQFIYSKLKIFLFYLFRKITTLEFKIHKDRILCFSINTYFWCENSFQGTWVQEFADLRKPDRYGNFIIYLVPHINSRCKNINLNFFFTNYYIINILLKRCIKHAQVQITTFTFKFKHKTVSKEMVYKIKY